MTIESYYDLEADLDLFIPYATKKISTKWNIPIDKVKIVWNDTELEYCIYINGKWCGYYDLDEMGDS
jgi:hypothetical protein